MTMQRDVKKILQISGFILFFIFIISYAFFRSQDLIFGIKIRDIKIAGLREEISLKAENSIIGLTGNAKNATNLTLNGREISIDKNGNFIETIALLPGYNIINLKAKDKFGYVDEKNYQIIY